VKPKSQRSPHLSTCNWTYIRKFVKGRDRNGDLFSLEFDTDRGICPRFEDLEKLNEVEKTTQDDNVGVYWGMKSSV